MGLWGGSAREKRVATYLQRLDIFLQRLSQAIHLSLVYKVQQVPLLFAGRAKPAVNGAIAKDVHGVLQPTVRYIQSPDDLLKFSLALVVGAVQPLPQAQKQAHLLADVATEELSLGGQNDGLLVRLASCVD
jgi:hypothetical protein